MNLPIYSSTVEKQVPNLVGVQHPSLYSLPTQLVCPVREDLSITPIRVEFTFNSRDFVVACDLVRPIRTTALHQIGVLEMAPSKAILTMLRIMFADLDAT